MTGKKNLKSMIRQSGLRQWEVAEKLGISEYTLVKWLRREENLHDDIRTKIIDICNASKEGQSKAKIAGQY